MLPEFFHKIVDGLHGNLEPLFRALHLTEPVHHFYVEAHMGKERMAQPLEVARMDTEGVVGLFHRNRRHKA